MMIKKGFVVLSILTLFLNTISAEPINLEDIVPEKYCELLKQDGVLQVIHFEKENDNLLLLPSTEYESQFKQRRVQKNPKLFNLVSENLYLIDKSTIVQKSKKKKPEISINDVSVVFRSISKMEGIKYYSNSRKRTETLYKESYLVDNPIDRNRIKDPIEGSADGKVLYCVQKDASFGRSLYELTYFQNENNFFASFNNIEKMGLGPLNAVSPGDMFIDIAVIDCGNQIVLYLMIECNTIRFPSIKNLLQDSMLSRIDAIQKWFLKSFN